MNKIGCAIKRVNDPVIPFAGFVDGYYEYNLNAWDVAAGIVILRQAGGDAVNFKGGGECLNCRELLATNGKITREMLETIQKHF